VTDEPEFSLDASCESEQPRHEVYPPAEQIVIIASLVCYVSLLVSYWIEKPAVGMISDPGERILMYSFIPAAITFAILYRSRWHPEIKNVARVGQLLLLSGIILSATLLAIPILLCVVWLIMNAFTGGSHP